MWNKNGDYNNGPQVYIRTCSYDCFCILHQITKYSFQGRNTTGKQKERKNPLVKLIFNLLKGKNQLFVIIVLQAALPQGIVPFVFAKEYNVYPEIISTG